MSALRARPLVQATLARWPGAEIVDVRKTPPLVTPASEDAAPTKSYSLSALATLARAEACRIEDTQMALVATGDRATPCAEQLARRDAFNAIATLIDRVRGDGVIMDRLRRGGA
jgi:hypothetical protein